MNGLFRLPFKVSVVMSSIPKKEQAYCKVSISCVDLLLRKMSSLRPMVLKVMGACTYPLIGEKLAKDRIRSFSLLNIMIPFSSITQSQHCHSNLEHCRT